MGKHEEHGDDGGPEALVEHLKHCREVDAAIVADGNADELVASLIEQGWTYEGTEYVEGKRVRYLVPPPGVLVKDERPGPDEVWDEAHREAWARRTVAAAGKDWKTHRAKFGGAVLPR
jgi:hypothetical protein